MIPFYCHPHVVVFLFLVWEPDNTQFTENYEQIYMYTNVSIKKRINEVVMKVGAQCMLYSKWESEMKNKMPTYFVIKTALKMNA